MNYRTVIVDNEQPHVDHLKNLLSGHFHNYQLVAECFSVPEGIERINELKPDLVFLDVEMPPFTGFDLLKAINQYPFEVIFATSFNEYALQAIKFSALDFLLKPYGLDDLQQALHKFENKIQKELTHKQYENLLLNLQQQSGQQKKISLASAHGMDFYKIEEIIRCESDNTYTTFFLTNNRQTVVSKPIRDWEDLLADFGFCRVHHQHLINLHHVKKYIKGEGGIVHMSDNKEVDVSRRKKDDFLKKLASI